VVTVRSEMSCTFAVDEGTVYLEGRIRLTARRARSLEREHEQFVGLSTTTVPELDRHSEPVVRDQEYAFDLGPHKVVERTNGWPPAWATKV